MERRQNSKSCLHFLHSNIAEDLLAVFIFTETKDNALSLFYCQLKSFSLETLRFLPFRFKNFWFAWRQTLQNNSGVNCFDFSEFRNFTSTGKKQNKVIIDSFLDFSTTKLVVQVRQLIAILTVTYSIHIENFSWFFTYGSFYLIFQMSLVKVLESCEQ